MFSSNRHLKSKNWSSSTLNSSLQALSHPLLLSSVSLYRHLHTILRFQEAGLKLLTRPTSFSLDEEMCPGMSKFFTGRSSHRVWAWGLNCLPSIGLHCSNSFDHSFLNTGKGHIWRDNLLQHLQKSLILRKITESPSLKNETCWLGACLFKTRKELYILQNFSFLFYYPSSSYLIHM